MRFRPKDEFWIVTDPTPGSTLDDIFFPCSLVELERQFRGGLTIEENPTLFTDEDEAAEEAKRRLKRL